MSGFSENRYIPEKIRKMTAYTPVSGNYSIHLDANESPMDIPEEIRSEFIKEIFSANLNRYPDSSAVRLIRAFSEKYNLPESSVVAGNGSDELIGLIISTFVAEGEGITVLSPDFSMYSFYAEAGGRKVNTFTDDFDSDRAANFVKDTSSKLCIFSNPRNPTGMGLKREIVLDFVNKCDALCVVDEAYMDFWDQSILSETANMENLIVLRTLSKAYGAAGLRIGFAVSNDGIATALNTVRSPYNVNSMSQILASILLEKGKDSGKYLSEQAKKLSAGLTRLLPNAKIYDTCTNFVYLKTPDAEKIRERCTENGIAIRIFGNDALRITAGTDQENDTLLSVLREFGRN